MEDEVVYRAAFDEDVGVVGSEPVKIIDGTFAGKHVIDLALDLQCAAIDLRLPRRVSDDAQISGFSREDLQVEGQYEFAGTGVGAGWRGCAGEGENGEGNDCMNMIFHTHQNSGSM